MRALQELEVCAVAGGYVDDTVTVTGIYPPDDQGALWNSTAADPFGGGGYYASSGDGAYSSVDAGDSDVDELQQEILRQMAAVIAQLRDQLDAAKAEAQAALAEMIRSAAPSNGSAIGNGAKYSDAVQKVAQLEVMLAAAQAAYDDFIVTIHNDLSGR